MKNTQLRQIIKEEIQKTLNEEFETYSKDPRFVPFNLTDTNGEYYMQRALRTYGIDQSLGGPKFVYRHVMEVKDNKAIIHFFRKPRK